METQNFKIPDLNKAQQIKIIDQLNDKLGHPIYEDQFDTWLDARVERKKKKNGNSRITRYKN